MTAVLSLPSPWEQLVLGGNGVCLGGREACARGFCFSQLGNDIWKVGKCSPPLLPGPPVPGRCQQGRGRSFRPRRGAIRCSQAVVGECWRGWAGIRCAIRRALEVWAPGRGCVATHFPIGKAGERRQKMKLASKQFIHFFLSFPRRKI